MECRGHWNLLFVFFMLCIGLGCGGNSGSRSGSPPVQNPIPTLSGISPNSSAAGSAAVTVTATGTGFVSSSVIDWNSTALATTFVSGTSLTAQVPATVLGSPATANVTVENPAPGGGTSSAIAFTINSMKTMLNVLDLGGSDLAWNPSQQKIYVAVPQTATSNPSTITIVDPIAGAISGSQTLNSAPSGLAISDDNQYLYAVTAGANSIQRVILPALTPDINWSLGTDSGTGNPYVAGDIKVQPGAPHTLAVSFGDFGSGLAAIFDDKTQRPSIAGGANSIGNSLRWKPDGTELYAADTAGSDSPDSGGGRGLYTMPVTNSGLGATTVYNSSFRGEGTHLQLDATSGFVYGDWGEVVDPANGIPLGNYPFSRPYGIYSPGPLSVVDPVLKRVYVLLQVYEPGGTTAFQIQSFDQTKFQLLSTIVISNPVGSPANFIRWGQSGLAFVTNVAPVNASGKLYILDGGFVNPSGSPDTTAGTQIDPVPTLTAMDPLTATVGASALTLTLTGRDFVSQPTVYWNGNTLSTTLVSGTQITAQVPASLMTTSTLATITASNGAGDPASNSFYFAVNAPSSTGSQVFVYSTGGNDLVWDTTAAKIYVAMPGIQGDAGDSIASVDPASRSITTVAIPGSEPGRLSLSSNNQYLYVALYGRNAIEQLALPTFNINNGWNLGGAGSQDGPYYAADLQAEPGSPQTTAVSLAYFDIGPPSVAVVLYDQGIPRPNPLASTAYPYGALQWQGTAPTLYSVDQQTPEDFLVLGVNASGAVLDQHYDRIVTPYSVGIHYDAGTGLVYTDGGQAIQPSDGSIVGTYSASGIAVSDSVLDQVFILGQTAAQVGTPNFTIESFDQTKFTGLSSITIDNVVGTPTALIRWGSNGLAFTTRVGLPTDFFGTGPGQLYVISGDFVHPSDRSPSSSPRTRMPPVHRTWNVGIDSEHRSETSVVSPNPMRQ